MATGDRPVEQRIIPTLMFVGKVCGKAEEAIQTYMSIFHDAKLDSVLRYGRDNAPDRENTIRHAAFTLEGQKFAAMDSAREHDFSFNEAISFIVNCDTQAEVDYYWEKLSAVPSAEACGWLKDRYGVSWQITPIAMREMLSDKDPAKVARLTAAFLKMKKFDIAALKETIR
jgi:predicted 3-demethylubiquinone-9 3-methyltransferase (glyoxalase superfamily)